MSYGKQYYKEYYEGKFFESTTSGTFEVIEYIDIGNVVIRFLDGTQTSVSSGNLRKGLVKNPNKLIKLHGVAECDINVDREDLEVVKAYDLYGALINRVYGEKFLLRNENYREVSVCDRWLKFSNFKCDVFKMKGFQKSISDRWELDKDLLSEGSKIYSPETCCFVPKVLNNLFKIPLDKFDKSLPTNVTRNKKSGKLLVRLQVSPTEYKHLGCFDTLQEAFPVYKDALLFRISNLLEEYREFLDDRLLFKLENYDVEKEKGSLWHLN